jgi:hypothetical protein
MMSSMKSLGSCLSIVFAFAASVVVGQPASADQALFRVQRTFLGAPFPAVTPGGAGRSILSLEPYKPWFFSITSMGATGAATGASSPPGVATVASGNPIGGAFTLPQGFIAYQGTNTLYPSTAFTGYLSKSYLDYINGQARFRPNNPYGATTTTQATICFNGNYCDASGVTSTTTHGNNFNFSRSGYLDVQPGANRFGGTMRTLYNPASFYYQYISYFAPLFFKAYGSFGCTKMGVTCTEGFETEFGEVTSSGMVSRYLLGTTVFTYPTPTSMGKQYYRKLASPPAVSKAYYLHLEGPWTTGMADVYGAADPYLPHPNSTGYDTTFPGGKNLTLTRTYTAVEYKGKGKTYYPTAKYYTKLTGVTRAVSLVRPRITHTYLTPRIPTDPIVQNYAANRVAVMKVFFLPEPGSMLLIAAGVLGVSGLAVLRRR